MRTVSYRIDDLKKAVIHIGHVAENEYTRVQIDAGDVYAEYPSAAVSLTVQPPAGEAFPAVVTRDGNMVIWDVKDSALTDDGMGEIQLTFTSGETVVKSCIGRISVSRSIVGEGEAPDPLEDFLAEAGAALTAIPETIDTALAEAKASGEFDGPPGADGKDGKDGTDGKDGKDGYTPVKGVDYFDGADGQPGADGKDGADGFSPTATVTKSGKTATISITDKNGTTTETVSDGEDGDPTALIDDSSTASNKVWSASKTNELKNAIDDKQDAPSSGATAGKVLGLTEVDNELVPSWVSQPSVPVTDVQVNGTSILNQGVANVPLSTESTPGVGKVKGGSYGIDIGVSGNHVGFYRISPATSAMIKAGNDYYHPASVQKQDESVFYGLAKASGDTSQSSSANAVGTYTANAKKLIRKMLGLPQDWELIYRGTTTQDLQSLTVITDSNGEPFALSEMYTRVKLPQTTTGTQDYVAGSTYVKQENIDSPSFQSLNTLRYTGATSTAFFEYYHQIIDGIFRTQARTGSGNANSQNLVSLSFPEMGNIYKVSSINGIKLAQYSASSTLIPSGTQIEIYGRRII